MSKSVIFFHFLVKVQLQKCSNLQTTTSSSSKPLFNMVYLLWTAVAYSVNLLVVVALLTKRASDASIYRKYRNIDSISIYRIVSHRPRKYRNFRYTGIDFLIYYLAEILRVVSRSREIFIETFFDTIHENSARESLNFFRCEKIFSILALFVLF